MHILRGLKLINLSTWALHLQRQGKTANNWTPDYPNGFASLKLNVVPFVKWYLHTFAASLNTKWSKMSAASAQSKLKCQRVMRDSKCYYISEGRGNISSQVSFNLCLTVVLHFVHVILLENWKLALVMLVLLICTCKLLTSVVVNRELTETFIVAINS